MYLSKLELVGFKSFAQKTQLKFSPGITAIVGPNGCGKTNIVDAIRWVLGEQKSAVLRSELMENVIFNGTSGRKALGMAEVSMTIMNNREVLPTEYNEVNLARRLFRDGESQYLLNNIQCRLKDIVDLFMDTGVGADTYSVIELKMIEAILSGVPKERRHLLEEAAGITKYKLRRKEASKKLQLIQGDLTRVQDIVSEVEKNVGTLARQAAKTRRFNKLSEELKELELAVFYTDFNSATEEMERFGINLSDLQIQKSEKYKQMNEAEENLLKLEKLQHESDSIFQQAIRLENELNSQTAEENKESAVADERISSLNLAKLRISDEIERNSGLIQSYLDRVKISESEAETLLSKRNELTALLSDGREGLDKARRKVSEARESVNETNESLINHQNKISSLNLNLKKNELRKITIQDRISNAAEEIEKSRLLVSATEIEIKNAELKCSEIILEIEKSETEIKSETDRKQTIQSEIASIKDSISQNRIDLSGKTASLEFLNGLLATDDSTKYLASSAEWISGGGKSTLAELIGADDDHRVAVEATLGAYANMFVVDNEKDAESAINLLKSNSKGKAFFLCRNRIPECKAPQSEVKTEGVIGWISELVRTDDSLRNAFRLIAGKTLLVRDYESASRCIELNQSETAITLLGEIISKDGVIRGGSVSKKEGLTVGKIERISVFEKEIDKLKKQIEKFSAELATANELYEKIDLNKLNAELKRLQSDLEISKRNLSQISFRRDSLLKSISLLDENIVHLNIELSEIDKEDASIISELQGYEEALARLREELKIYQRSYGELEIQLNESQSKVRDLELKEVALMNDGNNIANEIKRLREQILSSQTLIENLRKEESSNTLLNDSLIKLKEEINSKIEKLKEESSAAVAAREIAQIRKSEIEEQISQYSNDLIAVRKSYEKFVESMHQQELKASDIKAKMKHISEKLKENYEIEIENFEFMPPENFIYDDAKITISDLKERLNALGSVNFLALEEYDSQSQRLEFYLAQMKDLTESEKTLQETIEEINQTAENKFLATFEAVNENFKLLFKKLFGEQGECELKLMEGNILESDIDIMAKPPGKKPHSIDMLSGGEKTLTSIALLFGIYMVKPSPFCILDEVDAPLDDANIDKFLIMIREFSNNTQFLVVTHNKRTMEFADTLYGVTMQEEGISKLVSVRMTPVQEELA